MLKIEGDFPFDEHQIYRRSYGCVGRVPIQLRKRL